MFHWLCHCGGLLLVVSWPPHYSYVPLALPLRWVITCGGPGPHTTHMFHWLCHYGGLLLVVVLVLSLLICSIGFAIMVGYYLWCPGPLTTHMFHWLCHCGGLLLVVSWSSHYSYVPLALPLWWVITCGVLVLSLLICSIGFAIMVGYYLWCPGPLTTHMFHWLCHYGVLLLVVVLVLTLLICSIGFAITVGYYLWWSWSSHYSYVPLALPLWWVITCGDPGPLTTHMFHWLCHCGGVTCGGPGPHTTHMFHWLCHYGGLLLVVVLVLSLLICSIGFAIVVGYYL